MAKNYLLDDADPAPLSGTTPDEIKAPEPKPEELWQTWKKTPGPATLTPLMAAAQPTIQKALYTYGFSGDPNINIQAQLHVMSVLPRFDPKKAKLTTFLTNELRRVQRIGYEQNQTVKIPEQAMIDFKYIKSKERDLRDNLGRDATVDELADATGLSTRRISKLRTSVRQSMSDNTQLGEGSAPVGVAAERPELDDMYAHAFYGSLTDPLDQKIFEWTTGYGGSERLSKSDIARKLNRSVAAISQRSEKMATAIEELVQKAHQVV